MNHKLLPQALDFNETVLWPALAYFYGPCEESYALEIYEKSRVVLKCWGGLEGGV